MWRDWTPYTMYCRSIYAGASYLQPIAVAAPVCMYVSVFPDSPNLTSDGLWHLGNFSGLMNLTLHAVPASLGRAGQKEPWGWTRGLRDSLMVLLITGELQRHTQPSVYVERQ